MTFPISALPTPGATPIRQPAVVRPKMVPAQCVPCPSRSSPGSSVKFLASICRPAKAVVRCAGSIPVSSTATATPAPVKADAAAPTAWTPQLTAGAAVVTEVGVPKGRMSCIGMGGAAAMTLGSRLTSARALPARSSTVTDSSPGP